MWFSLSTPQAQAQKQQPQVHHHQSHEPMITYPNAAGPYRDTNTKTQPQIDDDQPKQRNNNRSPTKFALWDDTSSSSSSDDDSSSEEDSLFVSVSSSIHSDSDSEEEEEHPLGFDSAVYNDHQNMIGRTRYSLSSPSRLSPSSRSHRHPPSVSIPTAATPRTIPTTTRMRLLPPPPWTAMPTPPPRKSIIVNPGISNHTTDTKSMMHHYLHHVSAKHNDDDDDDMNQIVTGMERIASLVRAAGICEKEQEPQPQQQQQHDTMTRDSVSRFLQEKKRIEGKMALERERVKQEQLKAATALRLLIAADATAAAKIHAEEQAYRIKLEKDKEAYLLKLEKEEQERLHKIETQHQAQLLREKKEQQRIKREIEEQERIAHEEREEAIERAKPPSFVMEANELVRSVFERRLQYAAPFESSKDASIKKRRMQMKKIIVRGFNTLVPDERKIRSVVDSVVIAIRESQVVDDQAKQFLQQQQQGGGCAPEMAFGTFYLLDLIVSDVIKRSEAEGFNGTRGDGFPLAITVTLISTKLAEEQSAVREQFEDMMAAHLYAVCPMAIPSVSRATSVDGKAMTEFELKESLGMKKLKATSSDQEVKFETFERFLARTEGLISITAAMQCAKPINHTMLNGHKGAFTWLTRFLDSLPAPPAKPLPLTTAPVLIAFLTAAGHMLANTFADDFLTLVDTIQNTVKGRVDDGAIGAPSFTRLKKVIEKGFEGFRVNVPPNVEKIPNLYEGADPAAVALLMNMNNPAGTTNNNNNNNNSSSNNQSNMAFGGGGNASGFMQGSNTMTMQQSQHNSPFGMPSATTNTTSANPFGMTTTANVTNPFGQLPPQQQQQQPQPSIHNPFGATSSSMSMPMSNPSPFGIVAANNNNTQTTPFGGAPPQTMSMGNSNPTNASAALSNPFGGGGGGGGAINATPFSAQTTPFGSGGSSSSHQNNTGGGGGGSNKPPCRFFAQGRCTNGANCKFSHDVCTPSAAPNNDNQGGGGGGRSSAKPCSFYAQGKCRNGANCKFSHDGPAPGGGGGGNNNSFSSWGGPRR